MVTSDLQNVKSKYGITGNSDGLNRALDVALQVAKTDLSVLIIGESGVGKEVIPRVIHDNSKRKHAKYFAVNCGSIPEGTIDAELFGHEKGAFTGAIGEREGYFGSANGGTLFLDEVGELPIATQARLLRVLETGEYIRVGSADVRKTDVRIVAATNVNLTEAISENRFREDLYYRLNTIPIMVPPLRERSSDIVLLFRKFANEISEKYNMPSIQLTADAKEVLTNYAWPGNIRQLKNVTEQISVIEPNRDINAEILKKYIPESRKSRELVVLNPGKQQAHSFENEREVLYKILYELRQDVADLKRLVHNQGTTPTQVVEASSQPVQTIKLTATPPHIADEDVQDTEEYIEESLSLNDSTKQMIVRALEKNHGKRRDAAADLGISERTLYRKIKDYGLE